MVLGIMINVSRERLTFLFLLLHMEYLADTIQTAQAAGSDPTACEKTILGDFHIFMRFDTEITNLNLLKSP